MKKIPCTSPKYGGQNLACWYLCLWLLWTAFTGCCTLSWLSIWLWSEVVDPCFIYCHIFTQKLLFVALKQLHTMLWIINMLLFLIDCEQTQHPLWTQLSHWQMFMQNGEYTAFWYLQLLCDIQIFPMFWKFATVSKGGNQLSRVTRRLLFQ